MHLLLESHEREWRGIGALVSAVLHGGLVLVVVLAYREAPEREGLVERFVTYLVPPDRRVASPQPETPAETQWTGPPEPRGEGEGRVAEVATGPLVERDSGGVDTAQVGPQSDPIAELLTESVLTELQVDSVVRRHPESAAPDYPRTMLSRNMEGSAFVAFVVDSSGSVDLATFRVIRASHPDFAAAVRAALPGMRFRPAQVAGRPVSQLVQQPFTFRITRADSARARPPL